MSSQEIYSIAKAGASSVATAVAIFPFASNPRAICVENVLKEVRRGTFSPDASNKKLAGAVETGISTAAEFIKSLSATLSCENALSVAITKNQ